MKKSEEKTKGKTPQGSGLQVPLIGGKMLPKGTRFKKNPDGTITPILPKKKAK